MGADLGTRTPSDAGGFTLPTPYSENWPELLDTNVWSAKQPRWRGRGGKRPVVGRHGRDHCTKWPSSPDALRAAYCVGKECDVVILGGAKCALQVIGAKPKNWIVHEFGAMDPRSFLSGLDFLSSTRARTTSKHLSAS